MGTTLATSPTLDPRGDADGSPAGFGVEELRLLMRSVNDTTARLEQTHRALHAQVARLQRELASANEQIRRSRSLAELGEMAAGIAHEVRNPLGSIGLYAQMLSEDLADHPEQALLATKIGRAVGGLDAIVRDVLAFAQYRSIRPEEMTAESVVVLALDACEAVLSGGEIDVTAPRITHTHLVKVDAALLVQAMTNVIRNAAQAMTEAEGDVRRLIIRVDEASRRTADGRVMPRVVIAVRDTGPGIPSETRRRMFNPFFTTRRTGTGLGLAIVHRIIDAHGGQVEVCDLMDGEDDGGTMIEVCLPRSEDRDAPVVGEQMSSGSKEFGSESSFGALKPVREDIA